MQALLSGKKIVKKDTSCPWVRLDKEGNIIGAHGEPMVYTFKPNSDYEIYKEELLTKDEKALLNLLTANFGKRDFIRKREFILTGGIYETIQCVVYIQGIETTSQLPMFVRGTRFANLELGKGYHREDLGL